MLTQILPLQTQEEDNLNNKQNSENCLSSASKYSKKSIVFESSQKKRPNNHIKKENSVQLDNQIEEEVNSFYHLTLIIQSIQIGYFGLGYSLSYLTMSFTTVFSQMSKFYQYRNLQGSETSEQGVKELCPMKYYEIQSVMSGFQVARGILFANILGLGYLNPDLVGEGSHYWQFIFAMPAIISFYIFIVVSIIYRMDSPISLLKKNKNNLVKQIIAKIYKSNIHDQAMRKAILRLQYDEEHQEGLLSIFSKKHRTTLVIGCLLMFAYTWSGLYAVISYSSKIFAAMAKGDQTLNAIFVLILGLAQFTPSFFSSYVYERWGKRVLLLGGLTLMIFCQLIIIGLTYSDNLSSIICKYIVIIFFTLQFALTLGPITWSMPPEINPSEGTYFCFVTLFSWQLLLLYIFPSMNESLKISGCFIVFTILTTFCLVIFYYLVQETKGLNHAEIDKLYGK